MKAGRPRKDEVGGIRIEERQLEEAERCVAQEAELFRCLLAAGHEGFHSDARGHRWKSS